MRVIGMTDTGSMQRTSDKEQQSFETTGMEGQMDGASITYLPT